MRLTKTPCSHRRQDEAAAIHLRAQQGGLRNRRSAKPEPHAPATPSINSNPQARTCAAALLLRQRAARRGVVRLGLGRRRLALLGRGLGRRARHARRASLRWLCALLALVLAVLALLRGANLG